MDDAQGDKMVHTLPIHQPPMELCLVTYSKRREVMPSWFKVLNKK
jgi:hypothetical protein